MEIDIDIEVECEQRVKEINILSISISNMKYSERIKIILCLLLNKVLILKNGKR